MSGQKKISHVVTAAALATISTAASATTKTLDITVNQLLSATNQSYSGAFDISAFLAPDTFNHKAVSATITAYGYSDAQFNSTASSQVTNYNGSYTYVTGYYFVQTGGGYYVSQTCGSWWSGYYNCGYYVAPYGYSTTNTAQQNYQQTLTTTTRTDTVADQMILTAAGASGAGTTQQQPAAVGNYQYQNSQTTGSYYAGYTTTDYYARTIEQGSFGALLAQATLQEAGLTAANGNGLLNFTVTDGAGSFLLQKLSLSIDVIDTSAVPEPESWATMTGGLLAVGAAMRRRKRKAVVAA